MADVTALAELVFHGLLAAGPRGLLAAQLAAVAVAFVVIARDARWAGAADGAIAAVLLVTLVGAFPAFGVIRVQLFSIALFPVLFSLLRAEARRPRRTVWLVVPLFTLWSNLHGAVLVGLAMLLVYLALERARSAPLEALAVAVSAGLACCLTPALERTPHYFDGVLANDEARRAVGLWAPLSLRRPFDIVLALAGLCLLALAVARGRGSGSWRRCSHWRLSRCTRRGAVCGCCSQPRRRRPSGSAWSARRAPA